MNFSRISFEDFNKPEFPDNVPVSQSDYDKVADFFNKAFSSGETFDKTGKRLTEFKASVVTTKDMPTIEIVKKYEDNTTAKVQLSPIKIGKATGKFWAISESGKKDEILYSEEAYGSDPFKELPIEMRALISICLATNDLRALGQTCKSLKKELEKVPRYAVLILLYAGKNIVNEIQFPGERVRLLTRIAHRQIAANDTQGAIRTLETAYKQVETIKDPTTRNPYLYLIAHHQLEAGNHDAVRKILKSITDNDNAARVILLVQIGDINEAISEAAKLSPRWVGDYAERLNSIVNALIENGNLIESKILIQKLSDIAEAASDRNQETILVKLAPLQILVGNFVAAQNSLNMITDQNLLNEALDAVGFAHYKAGNRGEALSRIDQISDVSSKFDYMWALSQLQLKLGNKSDAIATLNIALEKLDETYVDQHNRVDNVLDVLKEIDDYRALTELSNLMSMDTHLIKWEQVKKYLLTQRPTVTITLEDALKKAEQHKLPANKIQSLLKSIEELGFSD